MQAVARPRISHYRYSAEWSPADEEFVATVAEFPSLSWLDDDQHASLRELENLVEEVGRDLEFNGEDVPAPFSERSYSGNLRVRVSPAEHRRLVVEAQKQGVSLNRFLSSILVARGQR